MCMYIYVLVRYDQELDFYYSRYGVGCGFYTGVVRCVLFVIIVGLADVEATTYSIPAAVRI